MAIKFNRSQTFATNGTVTAPSLHNLVDGLDIYQSLITDQTNVTSVSTADELLIAIAAGSEGDAPKAVTVQELFQDALTVGTYSNANISEALSYGTATGTRLVSTNATITTGTITTGVIPTLTSSTATFGTTTSTAATITSGTITNLASTTGVIPTLTSTTLITTGTGTAAAPAIVPTGDTNTGVFFPAADTIAATTNGTECLRIDSSGNVIISSNKSLISNGAGGIATNTSIGSSALSSNTTGSQNTAFGYDAIQSNTTGAFNTAIGYDALTNNTTGVSNVAVGWGALTANTTGELNVAVGVDALRGNTTGGRNVAVGLNALFTNTTGSQNTSCGYTALDVNTTGLQNTACGYAALGANTTGNLNTALGYAAGQTNTTGTNNTFIGNGSVNTSGGATASNTIVLGNSAITTLRCQTATISALSDARDKSNIEDIPVGIEFIKDLRPVKFTWNQRDGMRVGLTDAGFIAQESLDVVNKYNANWIGLVEDENKDQLAMTPGKLIPILVKAIQQLSAKVDSLESQLASK